jgi:hypothetical protein
MRLSKYYDWTRNKPLAERDGFSVDVWPQHAGERSFCVHPEGFPIFLDPAAMEQFDGYAGGDPYGNGGTGRRLSEPAGNPHRVVFLKWLRWTAVLLPFIEVNRYPFTIKDRGPVKWMILALLMPAVSVYSRIVKKYNSLASTVFYLARKK